MSHNRYLRLWVAEAAVMAALATGVMGQSLHLTPKQCPAGVKEISSCPTSGCGGVSDSLLDGRRIAQTRHLLALRFFKCTTWSPLRNPRTG